MHDLAQEIKLQTMEAKEEPHANAALYTLEAGVAQVARDGQDVSGDSYAVLPLKEGKHGDFAQ